MLFPPNRSLDFPSGGPFFKFPYLSSPIISRSLGRSPMQKSSAFIRVFLHKAFSRRPPEIFSLPLDFSFQASRTVDLCSQILFFFSSRTSSVRVFLTLPLTTVGSFLKQFFSSFRFLDFFPSEFLFLERMLCRTFLVFSPFFPGQALEVLGFPVFFLPRALLH